MILYQFAARLGRRSSSIGRRSPIRRSSPRQGPSRLPRARARARPPARPPAAPARPLTPSLPSLASRLPPVRVAAPPGGQTSWSLGWGADAAPAPARRTGRGAGQFVPSETGASAYAPAAAPAYSAPAPAYSAPEPAAYSAPLSAAPGRATGVTGSSNAFARGANQNQGNVLTDRPTSKVLAPPGGRSSIVFG